MEGKAWSVQIVSPMPPKGLGRRYEAAPEVKDETNYVFIGAVVKDGDGNVRDDVVVKVTATDGSQNKIMGGTGNYAPGVVNAKYYPFEYAFHEPGTHEIAFTAEMPEGGTVSESVSIEVE